MDHEYQNLNQVFALGETELHTPFEDEEYYISNDDNDVYDELNRKREKTNKGTSYNEYGVVISSKIQMNDTYDTTENKGNMKSNEFNNEYGVVSRNGGSSDMYDTSSRYNMRSNLERDTQIHVYGSVSDHTCNDVTYDTTSRQEVTGDADEYYVSTRR